MAAFLSQYSSLAQQSVRSLSGVARKLATELCTQWLRGVPASERSQLRSRECVLYGYALLCYSNVCGTNKQDVQEIRELIVLFQNSLLFANDEELREEVAKVKWVVNDMMSRHVRLVSEHASSQLMTSLCRLVNPQFPPKLTWYFVKNKSPSGTPFTTSFDATDESTGVHYLINTVNGTVLTDETPPLLTLGSKMTKDKLMQGAGRLRQLGCDQTLWLTSTGEVERSIRQATGCESASIGVAKVLHWVVESTQQQCTLGLLEWAQSAVDFCGKESDSKLELKKDDWSLEGQYAEAQVPMKISGIVHERIAAYRVRHISRILVQVENRATTYGRDDTVLVTTYGEECERELQIEREKELELRNSNVIRKPREETDWDYTVLLGATFIAPLIRTFDLARTFLALQDVIRSFLPGLLFHRIAWRDTQIYGTSNFWQTVLAPTVLRFVNNDVRRYLRMIDVFIVFSGLSVLLLTKREAHAVVKLLSSTPASPDGRFRIVHLEFLFSAIQRHGPDVTLSDVPLSIGYPDDRALANVVLSPLVLMVCRLLNGDTDFLSKTHPELTEETLRTLLKPLPRGEDELRKFVEKRRLGHRWTRSCLHDIAMRMDLK